ncbi:hypothetical protein FPQ10_06185 [Allobacillus sp. SKP2-8]|uniref:hypothetical protein n=1 Tax=unclassified Allobacillus TaxID=2628859 RepID=UPI0011826BDB|nr:hypothetical protein [Allobacillus sp. SKP2-8]TSJ67379.1 hypothetical protein FPQ10_06185 [Allobacillus sp. SKP2-8]
MSDFIYSKIPEDKGSLTKHIQSIYHEDKPRVLEFHGGWGSLAISDNIYNGFQPYESKDHICAVIGGPVLCFQENSFLQDGPGVLGTKAIYNRWLRGDIQFDEDLSGPFIIIVVNKITSEIIFVTDLMSFIPCYKFEGEDSIILSTHIDILAKVANQRDETDEISVVDFILHGVITYPYTVYKTIKQIQPATVHLLSNHSTNLVSNAYWIPKEKQQFNSIKQASHALRESLQSYVNTVTKGMSTVGQFISAGEDSRTLSALLPKQVNRDAFIFLDYMNREGKLAKKAADAYDANFYVELRNKTHYIDILPFCHDLVGSGSQYHHVHTFGFHRKCKLNEYFAVFGGLLSDALLKGSHIKKVSGYGRFPFLPQLKDFRYTAASPVENNVFTKEALLKLTERRKEHLNYVKSFRNESAEEWFELWPSSMNMNIPNIHGNRRLFKSYEPFTDKNVVKISASVPQSWKLNRRLFHHAAMPLLKPTKWLFHGEGRLPYFPWYINIFVQFIMWSYYQVAKRVGIVKENQGPWGEWNKVIKSSRWKKAIEDYSNGIIIIEKVLKENELKTLLDGTELNQMQKINLMQVMYSQSQH